MFSGNATMTGGAPQRQAPGPQDGAPQVNRLLPPEERQGEDEDALRRRMLADALRGVGAGGGTGFDKLGKGLGDIFGAWMKSRQGPGPAPAPADLPPMTVGSGAGGLY
jgi:hypothetical protein